MIPFFAYLPSPPFDSIGVGPLEVHAYGVVIAIGVLVGMWIARRRWTDRGGDPDDISSIALAVVPAGLIGARVYHLITDFSRYRGDWWRMFEIWEGGLGIFGAITAGVLAGVVVARRRHLSLPRLLDAAAPAIPVAQAIGRLGNWFNQELYGRPTDLPWALRIDVDRRPDGLVDVAHYHPTFLYEGLWSLALAGVLVLIGRRWRPRPGQLFACYVAGYAMGRLWVETLRIDPATDVLGLRVNLWVAGAVLVAAIAFIVINRRWGLTAEDEPPAALPPTSPADHQDAGQRGETAGLVSDPAGETGSTLGR
jgi:prolipoprotein diacylglyceryl transferase